MNVYQKVGLAFLVGVVASLLLRDDLVLLAAAAFIIFVMMFAKTWVCVFTFIQGVGWIISAIGHFIIGLLGDLIVRGSCWAKARLRQSTTMSLEDEVSESPTHDVPVDTSTEGQPDQSSELDIPDFMKEGVPSTDNVGLDIFEPANG